MSNSNDFVAWATAIGANVAAVASYQALAIRQQGAQIGIADPVSFNNAMRQATSIAAMVAQFTADYGPSGNNVQDNGDLATLETQFVAALTQLINGIVTPSTGSLFIGGGNDSGSANNYVLTTPSSAVASYVTDLTIVFKPANTNTGGSVVNVAGLGNKTIVRTDGSALQAGDLNNAGLTIISYDGTRFVLIAVLQTVAGVPVATTSANGVSREATNAEMTAGATSGSVPAFVTPDGLPLYAELKWTVVGRSSSHTETAYNEYIELSGSSNFTTTLKTPAGVAFAYMIFNGSSVAQNIAPGANAFSGVSDIIGGGGAYLVVPSGAYVFIQSDQTNWIVGSVYNPASTTNRGVIRVATNAEATAGVTSGTSFAAMTPEDVALFFYAAVATTSARGISRQATTSEMTNGATAGSSPAFVTPEGLGLSNPFLTTGPGAAILASTISPLTTPIAVLGETVTWSYLLAGYSATGGNFCAADQRWPSSAPPGNWELVTITLPGSNNYSAGGNTNPVIGIFVRIS